jgi:hypothetical protein
VSRTESPVERALQRMLDADDAKNAGFDDDDWVAWQRAATDYWVLLHPNLAPFRRGDPARIPTISEIRDRAELVARAMDDIPDTWRLAPPSRQKAEHLARVGWSHELLAGLYGPVEHAIERLRRDDPSGVETLVRFLEADVYCFGSGYAKAEVIRFLTRADLNEEIMERLRRVALAVVDGFDRREFRAYIRLGRRVDSAAFRDDLRTRLDSESNRTKRHAHWMLVGLGEPSSD